MARARGVRHGGAERAVEGLALDERAAGGGGARVKTVAEANAVTTRGWWRRGVRGGGGGPEGGEGEEDGDEGEDVGGHGGEGGEVLEDGEDS